MQIFCSVEYLEVRLNHSGRTVPSGSTVLPLPRVNGNFCYHVVHGPVSMSDNASYRKISQSLEAARLVFRIERSHWNLTGTSAAVLPMCLSNLKAMRWFKLPISRLRFFTSSYDTTSYRILKRGPGRLDSRLVATYHPQKRVSSFGLLTTSQLATNTYPRGR